jgi:hypothetical protein
MRRASFSQVEDVDIDGVWESEVVLQGYAC